MLLVFGCFMIVRNSEFSNREIFEIANLTYSLQAQKRRPSKLCTSKEITFHKEITFRRISNSKRF